MYNQNSFHCPPHADLVKLFPHALKPSCHRTVLLIQGLLCTKCVICQRIPARGEKIHYCITRNLNLNHSDTTCTPRQNLLCLMEQYLIHSAGLEVLVCDLGSSYRTKICTMIHTSAESPADRYASVVLVQQKERNPEESAATVIKQPLLWSPHCREKAAEALRGAGKGTGEKKLCWEGSKLHRTVFFLRRSKWRAWELNCQKRFCFEVGNQTSGSQKRRNAECLRAGPRPWSKIKSLSRSLRWARCWTSASSSDTTVETREISSGKRDWEESEK